MTPDDMAAAGTALGAADGNWATAGEGAAAERRGAAARDPRRARLGLRLPLTTAKARAAIAGLPLEIREGPSTTGSSPSCAGPANGPHGAAARRHGRPAAAPRTPDSTFASRTDGAMHACGHDTHVAMLAGAARAALRAPRATGRHGDVHVPAGRGGLARRPLHDRRRPARSAAGRRLRPAHLAQHAGRGLRRPRRPAARLGGQAAHRRASAAAATPPCRTTRSIRSPIACEIVLRAADLGHPPDRASSTRR